MFVKNRSIHFLIYVFLLFNIARTRQTSFHCVKYTCINEVNSKTLWHRNAKIVERQTLHLYDLMNTIYFNDFSIFLHFRERERQLQLTLKPKYTLSPIGRAIFY
jgi:hypothetical protein